MFLYIYVQYYSLSYLKYNTIININYLSTLSKNLHPKKDMSKLITM